MTTQRDSLLTQLQDKPAWLLVSLSRQARDSGKYSDAILYLKVALASPYGSSEFEQGLKEATVAANMRLNKEAAERLAFYATGHPAGQPVVEFFLLNRQTDPIRGTERVLIEVRSYLSERLSSSIYASLSSRASFFLQEELTSRFPRNPVRFFETNGRYYFEGYFNSEYPEIIPDVQYDLAMLYKEIHDYVLADQYFRQALNQRQYFSIPERVYDIRYALADMYRFRGQSFAFQYEKVLKEIVAEDSSWNPETENSQRQRDQMQRVLMEDPLGLDKVLQLYRLNDDFSRNAHRYLGVYYLQRRNYEEALPHLIYAAIKPLSRLVEEIKKRNFGYQVTDIRSLLIEAGNYPEIVTYLKNSGLYEALFALAEVTAGYQPNYQRLPRSIWQIIAGIGEAGEFGIRAQVILSGSNR